MPSNSLLEWQNNRLPRLNFVDAQNVTGDHRGCSLVMLEVLLMATKLGEVKRGDKVRIISGGGLVGRIVELRGPLGPKGMLVYRVLLRKKPKPTFVEVREDQLELLPEGN